MKNFQENVDEASINQVPADRFAGTVTTPRTFRQRVVQLLSRYSLLMIVGLAALSITVLHFQGQFLLQALRGTPLPIFGLDEAVDNSPLPDKTKVYKDALAEEAKQVTRPSWQTGYQKLTAPLDTATRDTAPVDTIVVAKKPPVTTRTVRSKRRAKKPSAVAKLPPVVAEKKVSFFQPVKAVGTPRSDRFLACAIHGDQEVANRKQIVLRLTEAATVESQIIPTGTLIYGMARLGQDRIQVTVTRMGSRAVQYQVYDHTYHEGILLNGREDRVQQASRETAVRQVQRNTYRLPTQIASDVARDLLGQTRRRNPSVFLPDGYPLYISSTEK